MLLRLSGPRTAVLVPRRRRASWRLVRVVVVGVVLVGVGAVGVAGWLRRVPASAPILPIAVETSAVGADWRGVLSSIRADAEAAQLEVRISVPLVAEAGLPVTARRLLQSDARLSAILGAVDAAATALERTEAAAGRSEKDGVR